MQLNKFKDLARTWASKAREMDSYLKTHAGGADDNTSDEGKMTQLFDSADDLEELIDSIEKENERQRNMTAGSFSDLAAMQAENSEPKGGQQPKMKLTPKEFLEENGSKCPMCLTRLQLSFQDKDTEATSLEGLLTRSKDVYIDLLQECPECDWSGSSAFMLNGALTLTDTYVEFPEPEEPKGYPAKTY